MGSLPTGSDELIYIQTEKVNITIKGNAAHPASASFEYEEKCSALKVYCNGSVDRVVLKGEEQNPAGQIYSAAPIFFEQKSYELLIEGNGEEEITFWHVNKRLRDSVTRASKNHPIYSGIINFGNDIGYSDFVIQIDGKDYLRITVEVFPAKISYREDYQAIRADVTSEIYNVIFDFLKKTYHGYQQSGNHKSSPVEFFAVISQIYDEFLKSAEKIISQPYHELQTYREILPAHKARRTDTRSLRWLEMHPEHVARNAGGIRADRVLAVKKHVSYDTKENRLAKRMIMSTIRRLEFFRQQYQLMMRDKDPQVMNKINAMIGNLRRRVDTSFLAGIENSSENIGMSLVFSMAPGYRELFKYYLMLQRGLDVIGDVFNVSVKDLAVLYEYWCFIKLNSMLKDKYDLISQDIIRVDGSHLSVALVKGQNSKVRYRNARNGEYIVLSYNPKMQGIPTVAQRPDNVLTLEKRAAGSATPKYEYVFDAKYKIDPSLKGSYYHDHVCELPGPKEEDINTMHRYRDAIVTTQGVSNFERSMFGAYVLFPYSDEEKYKAHRFYESIEKVNIGGLPFLPSATSLVEELLEELITSSPETAFESSPLSLGIEEKLAKVNWEERDVLIGTLRNREQLDICRRYRFYHIPKKRVRESELPVRYVAIYQSGKLFGRDSGIYIYGEVIRAGLVKRRDIHEIPSDSDELYYRFDIKEWKILEHPIAIREHAETAMYTNMFLLQNGEDVSDLRIRSDAEYRTYNELKRMFDQVESGSDDNPPCFRYKEFQIDYRDGDVRLMNQQRILATYAAKLFVRRPIMYFRKLMDNAKIVDR